MIFSYDKIGKTWNTGGMAEAIKDFISKSFTKADVPEEISKFFSGKNLGDNLFGENGILSGKGF